MRLKILSQIVVMISLLLTALLAYAKNIGTFGQAYAITEEDFLVYIERKLTFMQKTGELEKMQKEVQKRVTQHIDRPEPLTSITRTITPHSWNYDPSIIVPYDLHDHNGKVFSKAGTKINPLAMVTLHTALAFYDADDIDQVQWVEKINKIYPAKIKFVLVNGSITGQEKLLHTPIYFDQQGRLTTKFHIKHVPALVHQQGLQLKIDEVLP